MTISKRVQKELKQVAPIASMADRNLDDVAQNTTREARARREAMAAKTKGQAWTKDEHARFLEAVALYPSGPWEAIAEHVGSKNARQTMTHAQKCRQKNERRARGLRSSVRRKKSRARSTSQTELVDAVASVMLDAPPRGEHLALIKTESNASYDSPRSGEECDPDALLTFECPDIEDALVREIFDQFPAPPSLQSAWSTSSFPDAPLELADMDDLSLSALPDDFALQWAV